MQLQHPGMLSFALFTLFSLVHCIPVDIAGGVEAAAIPIATLPDASPTFEPATPSVLSRDSEVETGPLDYLALLDAGIELVTIALDSHTTYPIEFFDPTPTQPRSCAAPNGIVYDNRPTFEGYLEEFPQSPIREHPAEVMADLPIKISQQLFPSEVWILHVYQALTLAARSNTTLDATILKRLFRNVKGYNPDKARVEVVRPPLLQQDQWALEQNNGTYPVSNVQKDSRIVNESIESQKMRLDLKIFYNDIAREMNWLAAQKKHVEAEEEHERCRCWHCKCCSSCVIA